VTQRPSILSSVDKIMMLKQGAIHAYGTRDDIIAKLAVSKTTKSNGALASTLPANGPARKDN
jgi:ATP-binding cassette, subfamily C, type I secretion system permease/ATPase